ncbi:MAG: hypothetical protein GTO18_02210 [Anaerolineales bacterium]|nr:hypothetical protein [Anaerolineales bacterium]
MKSRFSVRKMTHSLTVVLVVILLGIFASSVFADNPAAGVTTTGQGLEVEITVDGLTDSTLYWDGTAVLTDAVATLGAAPPIPVNYVYVEDVSGSMENSSFNPFQDIKPPAGIGPEDDCNGDGIQGSAMDAACFGLISLNVSLGDAANVDVGIVAFGDGAQTADMDPAVGSQIFTSPPDVDKDAAGGPDVIQVIEALDTQFGGSGTAGVGLFTNQLAAGFAFKTDYDAALTAMNASFASEPGGEINIAAFLTDGEPTSFTTGPGSPLANAVAAGTTVHTFAIGTIAPGRCNVGQHLRTISDSTGGTCTEVADPSTLGAILPEVLTTNLLSLDLKVNGAIVGSTAGPDPDTLEVSDVDISVNLYPGINTIEATAIAEDGTEVTASLEVTVFFQADVEIVSWDVPTPESLLAPYLESGNLPISEWVTISTTKTLHNLGPYGPVNVDGAFSWTSPDVDVAGSTVWSVSDLEVSIPTDINEDFSIHCFKPGTYTIPFRNDITAVEPDNIYIIDPNPENNGIEESIEVTCVITVPVDVKPNSCRNPLNTTKKGVLPIAILGTEDFDVTQIDPATVMLEGAAPLRWSLEDVATPFEPYVGKVDAFDCTEEGSDGYMDLTLKFEAQEVVSALGDVSDGQVLLLHLTGNLKSDFGGHAFYGEDVVVILEKGKD